MASKHGKTFEKDMLRSVRSWGWWAERFRDNTFGSGSRVGSHESPPDMIAIQTDAPPQMDFEAGVVPVLMELKAINHPDDLEKATIPLSRCKGHQLERLLAFPGEAFVVVMFYEGVAARKRSAVMIPVQAWASAQDRYGRLSVRLDALREDLPAHLHLRWVGRKADIGPWVRCTRLGLTPKEDT